MIRKCKYKDWTPERGERVFCIRTIHNTILAIWQRRYIHSTPLTVKGWNNLRAEAPTAQTDLGQSNTNWFSSMPQPGCGNEATVGSPLLNGMEYPSLRWHLYWKSTSRNKAVFTLSFPDLKQCFSQDRRMSALRYYPRKKFLLNFFPVVNLCHQRMQFINSSFAPRIWVIVIE